MLQPGISSGIIYRQLAVEEAGFLEEMLFESIYLPPEEKFKLGKEIIYQPALKKYYEHWGRKGDQAVVAVSDVTQKLLGCAWGRLYSDNEKGYGFISDTIPELSIAIYKDYRNQGMGTKLLCRIKEVYKNLGIHKLSLSVDKRNPAVHLYQREGFSVFHENENDFVMLFNASVN
jgi:[ribosomal protein S18]-alanine N-acetyltransferase